MGIEPTSRYVSNDSTALKTAGPSTQVATPQALTKPAEPDYTKNDTKDADLALIIQV